MNEDIVSKSVPTLRDSLGLTEAEAKAIVPIYLGGNMTAGGVALLTGEKLTSVQKTLDRLAKKGLIKQIEGIVPVYRALPPGLALSGILEDSVNGMKTLSSDSEQLLSSRITDTESIAGSIIESQTKSLEELREALTSYENQVLELVTKQIENVVITTSGTMTGFSDEIEQAMNGLDGILDESLGAKLSELHEEIDKAQLAMNKEVKLQVREFDKWLKSERKGTLSSVAEFQEKSAELVESAKGAVTDALSKSSELVRNLSREISGKLTSMVSTASDDGVAVISGISAEISQMMNSLDGELAQAYLTGQESLKEIITQARSVSKEYGEFAKNRIGVAVEIADSVSGVVEDWKNEVSGFMEVASQSVTSQLDQVASTDASYLEVMKNSLTSHVDKVNESLASEYSLLSSLATKLGSETEATHSETRSLLLDLLQTQNEAEQKECEFVAEKLNSELDKWVSDSSTSIEKKMKEMSKDISAILDTETSELNSISKAMNSRLKSAFNSVIKSTSTKNEALLTSVKKTTHEFDVNIGSSLEELIKSYTTATERQVLESRELYEGLRERLDTRISQSVSAINSQADRIQKGITNTIAEQTNRIDQHAQGIREEFHNRLDDITNQFLSLTHGLEATFNGLLSSQVVEARDLIASAHSEFRTILKNEISALKDDSTKIQQEYSTNLALKIDDVSSFVASVEKALNELAVQKRFEISESMAKTLADLETSVRSTEDSLREIESGTVAQFIENMEQVSQEFKVTVAGASENIAERLDSVKEIAAASFTKSSAAAKLVADGFVAEQKDNKQRFLVDTSKKMNRLATKRAKDSAASIEAFQTELSEHQTGGAKDRGTAKEEVFAAVESRRSEVANAFDAASVWVDSSVANISTSLEAFGRKLKNELTLMQKGLQKAADEAASAIQERGEADLDSLQEIVTTLIQNTESQVKTRVNEFGDGCSDALSKGSDSFTSMPTELSDDLDGMEADLVKRINQDYSTTSGALSSSFTECIRSAESVSEGFKRLLENTSINLTKHRDEVFEHVQKSTELANQYASQKFNAIGMELKTQLSSDSSHLLEKTRLAFSTKNKEITDTVTKTTNTINAETSTLKQNRNKAISLLGANSEKTLKRWSKEQKDQASSLRDRILETIVGITGKTEETIKILNAIHDVGDEVIKTPSKRTWYLSGKEEACAHIVDMADRAKDSVVISILDSSCLDYKSLAKVKQAKRRVIVVPESEEPDPNLSTLEGWRIWQTKTPMLLSIIDDRELLVGGATPTEDLIALISEDEAYLRLYHEILGPRLVRSRVI